MKKKIILSALIILIGAFNVYSQILSNTKWAVYDTTNTFFVYFHFDTDTLSYSEDNISYSLVSTYQESGNNFNIVDLSDETCPVADTGRYTFLIQNDTLKFTLIDDLCDDRKMTITEYHWANIHLGINNTTMLPIIKIYPNPASDEISIESKSVLGGSEYVIFDQHGKQIINGKLSGEITIVNIKQLAKGLYFIQIGEERKQTIKIIKK